jgi:hypothetical protein
MFVESMIADQSMVGQGRTLTRDGVRVVSVVSVGEQAMGEVAGVASDAAQGCRCRAALHSSVALVVETRECGSATG